MPAKKTKYVAVYQHDGRLLLAERTSARQYNFASVVQYSDGKVVVGYSFSATEAGAAKCLTAGQKSNGARVIAVVKAEPQPDLSAASKQLGQFLNLPPAKKTP